LRFLLSPRLLIHCSDLWFAWTLGLQIFYIIFNILVYELWKQAEFKFRLLCYLPVLWPRTKYLSSQNFRFSSDGWGIKERLTELLLWTLNEV
jgi:hypothetical protein